MAAETLVELYRFDEGLGTYSSCCTLIYPEPDVCYIKGLSVKELPSLQEFAKLKKHIRKKGVRLILFRRDGRLIEIPLRPVVNSKLGQ